MRYFLFFLFFVFNCLITQQTLSAKTLHAILVADTVHDIRSVTYSDLQRWQEELKVIAKHTKMILKECIFSGAKFNKEKVRDYIENLSIDRKDSVIFYFTGHGYRTFSKNTPWPFILFDYSKPGLDIQWVTDLIRKKKPQFALVMTDCCNNYRENGLFGSEDKQIRINLRSLPKRYEGYQRLFSLAEGCVVISSCSAGQFSYGSRFGGLYTQCFFTSLSHELTEKSPSWKKLLQRANGYINHIQRPICEVYR